MPPKKTLQIILIWAFFCTFSTTQLLSQTIGLGSWNILNLRYRYSEKFSFFGEGELRSLGFYYNYHYHELGVNA
jgi:hypothetical protein